MEKKREKTDFELALDLIKFQYENDPYQMTKEQLEKKRALLKSCIDAYPGVDKHTINIMVDYYIMHPEKLDADNRLDNEEEYNKYLGKA